MTTITTRRFVLAIAHTRWGIVIGAALLAPVVAVVAQDWTMERTYRGAARGVVVRGSQLLVIGSDAPSIGAIDTFGLPRDSSDMLRPEPRSRIVTSADRTQVARVSVTPGERGPRSRYTSLDRSATIEAPGLPDFFVSNNGAVIVVAHMDIHSQRDTLVEVYDGKGALLKSLAHPRVRRIHLASDGSTLGLAGDLGLYVYAIAEGSVSAIGELPPALTSQMSDRGDWIARGTDEGCELHQRVDGRFSRTPSATLPTSLPGVIKFDETSSHLAVATARRVQLFALDGRRSRWEMPSTDRSTVTSIDLSADAALVSLVTVTVERPRTRSDAGVTTADVQLFRQDGTTLAKQSLPGNDWSASAPAVMFFDQGRQLLIETKTDVFKLSSRGAVR